LHVLEPSKHQPPSIFLFEYLPPPLPIESQQQPQDDGNEKPDFKIFNNFTYNEASYYGYKKSNLAAGGIEHYECQK
jgi:hypothetical protein